MPSSSKKPPVGPPSGSVANRMAMAAPSAGARDPLDPVRSASSADSPAWPVVRRGQFRHVDERDVPAMLVGYGQRHARSVSRRDGLDGRD